MCLYPRLIKNRKYTATKKNGGNIPPLTDPRVGWVSVGCQECIECTKQRANGWKQRLMEDIKVNRNARFITLTFSDESVAELAKEIEGVTGYELDNAIATLATRRWLERWRKKHKRSLRHWLVTEIGHNGTENIHLHGIVWTDKDLTEVETTWRYGFIWKGKKRNDKVINYVNEGTITYISKYITKRDEKHKKFTGKILTSAGIGANYTDGYNSKQNKYVPGSTNETYRTKRGNKVALCIYYRNKIYTETEREKLWIEKLDKGIRYICGEKVDEKDTVTYYGLLNWYRKRNGELGYGTGEKDWEREEYERNKRTMMQEKRIHNAKVKEMERNFKEMWEG